MNSGDRIAPVARNGEPCDCETPGDWHRVANDFQQAMFRERERAEKCTEALRTIADAILGTSVSTDEHLAWVRAVARSGLRGSGPMPQNSETVIPYQQVKAERDTALDALAHEETESRRLAGMVMSLDLLVMSANEIICNSPGNIQPWLDACAVLGRNLTPRGE